ALVGALAQRVRAVGDVGAGAHATGHGARPAGPGAGGAAADALLAEGRVALGPATAGRTDRLLAAAAVDAGVGRQAVGVAGADGQAAAVLAAVERRARLTGRRRAHAHAVAAARRRQHEPGARHLLADGAGRIHVALAGAVAHTRRTARRRGLHGTLVARIGPDLRVDAGADGALARAGHARARARDVAADAVGAEPAGALGAHRARRADRLARHFDPHVGGRVARRIGRRVRRRAVARRRVGSVVRAGVDHPLLTAAAAA